MAKIPKQTRNSQTAIDAISRESYFGPYLAMSTIGGDCFRAIWLGFRWCSKEIITGKTLRIFRRGNYEEDLVCADLEAIGCTVTNRQEKVYGWENYSKGKIDGQVINLPERPMKKHLLEIKTMNDKYFQLMLKAGLRISDPKYYKQVMQYMGRKKLKDCLVVVTNKNDEDRRHLHIRFNQNEYNKILEVEKALITCGNVPNIEPPHAPSYYKCGWCKHGEFCYANKAPEVTCRSCVHCDLIGNSQWKCAKKKKILDRDAQVKACKKYKRLF